MVVWYMQELCNKWKKERRNKIKKGAPDLDLKVAEGNLHL